MPANKASKISYGAGGTHQAGTHGAGAGAGSSAPLQKGASLVGRMSRQASKSAVIPTHTNGFESDSRDSKPAPMNREKSKLETSKDSVKLTRGVSRLDPVSPAKKEKKSGGGANAGSPHGGGGGGMPGMIARQTSKLEGVLKRQPSKLEGSRDSVKMTRESIDSKELATAHAGVAGKTGDSVKLTRERSIQNMESQKRKPSGAGSPSSSSGRGDTHISITE
jgi:hypothetical protein